MLEDRKPGDIKNIEAEAGVIASVIMNPSLTFYSEVLQPHHFTDPQNAYIYWAVRELVKKGVDSVDAYNIKNMLSAKKATEKAAENITIQSLNDLFDVARNIARTTPEDYKIIVDYVMDAAFRRDTYNKLMECERLCFNSSCGNIEHKIYETLDNVMMEFSAANEVPQYKDVVEKLWNDIEAHQKPEQCGAIPFKFPTLNQYVMIERGELVVFGGAQKSGKSMLLLNTAVDLLRSGYKVLYLDSELNSKLFTCRLVSHLTGISFQRVRHGDYDASERERIAQAVNWMKTREFTHLYMPVFDEQTIYTTVKKVYHTQGIDVLIIDYFKGGDNPDAFATYQGLGGLVDKQSCSR